MVFPNDFEQRLFPVFLKGGADHHPFHPALKGTLVLVLIDLFENHKEGILQVILRLLIAGGILEAHGKQSACEELVQLLLGLDVLLLALLYEFL